MKWEDLKRKLEKKTHMLIDPEPALQKDLHGRDFYVFCVARPERPESKDVFGVLADGSNLDAAIRAVRSVMNRQNCLMEPK